MSDQQDQRCPECEALEQDAGAMSRRRFMKAVGGTAVTLSALQAVPRAMAQPAPQSAPATPITPKPAELMVRELYTGLTEAQRRDAVFPWNHGAGANNPPTRLRFYNAAIARRIGEVYSPAQRQLIEQILRAISSGDDGYRRISRNGTWDNSGSLQNCGAYVFGDPTGNQQFSFVFTGHHLTVRCDGNSEPDAAFGGPMYYGHSPDGYSQRNIFFYQTQAVRGLFDALNGNQQGRALVTGSPGELLPSVRFRDQDYPGLPVSEMTADQRGLVQTVMRAVLSPFRQEDADEVMDLLRRNGGLERIHIAFYRDQGESDNHRWHFWRLEGPGFVWNYRVLPHVHTYVNIALRPAQQGA
jgi:hypothetical protein